MPCATSCPWWIGDLLNYGDSRFGVTDDQLGHVGAASLFPEQNPIVEVDQGTVIPSESEAAHELTSPSSGQLLIESRGQQAVLLENGRVVLASRP
jgi:hypothetical protein